MMDSRSKTYYRFRELYRRLTWRKREYDRLAHDAYLRQLPGRLHVEELPARLMMSVTPGAQTTSPAIGLADAAVIQTAQPLMTDASVGSTSNSFPSAQTTGQNTALVFSADADNAITIGSSFDYVEISVTNGTLTLSKTAGLSFGNGSANGESTLYFGGGVGAMNNALDGLVYQPANNSLGSDVLSITTSNGGLLGLGILADTASGSVGITVEANNRAPTVSVPTLQTGLENQPVTFSTAGGDPITVADSDSGGLDEQVTLSTADGTLALATTSGITIDSGSSSGQSSMTFTGTIAAINAALNGLQLTPRTDYYGSASINVGINDLGHSGFGGAQAGSNVASATLSEVNQVPTLSVPTAAYTNENTTLPFGDGWWWGSLSMNDVDSQGATEQLSLSVSHGVLSLSSTMGLTFVSGTQNNSAAISIRGSVIALNLALSDLSYTPAANFHGNDALALTANDLGNTGLGGALTASASVTLNVAQVNQPPTVSVPGQQWTTVGAPVVFGASAITVADSDGGTSTEQVTLTAADGVISLPHNAPVTITAGTGANDSTVTFQGTLAQLNAALSGMTFTPAAGFVGAASLGVTINDLGATGAGGAKAASASITIRVLPAIGVTTTADIVNGNVSSVSALLANNGADSAISLREAIEAINNTPGSFTIDFAIGSGAQTIQLSSALPAIERSVVIDGTSQPGYAGAPLIELDGSLAGPSARGLVLDAGASTVSGIGIGRFGGVGLTLSGAGGDLVIGNDIGLTPSNVAWPNGSGISVLTANNVIGGSTAASQNIISSNLGNGVTLSGVGASGNVIAGNYIGVDSSGSTAAGNGGIGVAITGGAAGNNIGGGASRTVSLASDFNRTGIAVDGATFSTSLDGAGFDYSSNQLGSTVAWDNAAFSIGTPGASDVISAAGQTIALPAQLGGAVELLATAVDGHQASQSFVVTYADNTTQTFTQSLSDWKYPKGYSGESIATTTAYRDEANGTQQSGPYYLYGYSFALNASKIVKSITLPANANVDVLALDLASPTAGNIIAHNNVGVGIWGNGSIHNSIVGANVIDANASIDIDLGLDGVTANGAALNSTAPNDAMDYPILAQAVLQGASLTVTGCIGAGGADSAFGGAQIEFFQTDGAAGHGGSASYIGAAVANADGSFTATLSAGALTAGDFITAVATNASGDSSEFSANAQIVPADVAPTISAPAAVAAVEDQPIAFSTAGQDAIAVGDTDSNGGVEELTLSVASGSLSIDPLTGVSFTNSTANASADLDLTGTISQLNAVLQTLIFTPAPSASGVVTLYCTINDQGNSGVGGPLSASAQVQINVAAVNHAPVLDPTAPAALANIPVNDASPAGDTVLDIISIGASDPISDLDAGALQGIAVVRENSPASGQWQYMLSGGAWTNLPAVSASSATLLPTSAMLRFIPTTGWSGTATLSFRAWDQTSGSAGQTGVDTSANGGSTAFSTTVDMATEVVTPMPRLVNDAGAATTPGTAAPIGSDALKAVEVGAAQEDLIFTLTAAPTGGQLVVGGQTLSVGSSFLQSDITAGRVAYVPAGALPQVDSFSFVVSDTGGQSLPPTVFTIHVNAAPPVLTPPASQTTAAQTAQTIPPNSPIITASTSTLQASAAGVSSPTSDVSAGAGESSSSNAGDPGGSTGTLGGSSSATPASSSTSAGPSGSTPTADRSSPLAAPLLSAHSVWRAVSAALPRSVVGSEDAPASGSASSPNSARGDLALFDQGEPGVSSRATGMLLGSGAAPANDSVGRLADLAKIYGSYRGAGTYQPAYDTASPLWRELDQMQSNLAPSHKIRLIAGSASLATMGVSVMYFIWAVRAGSILSSFLSSMPAWRLVDPLPILDQMAIGRATGRRAAGDDDDNDDDDTLESMVDKQTLKRRTGQA